MTALAGRRALVTGAGSGIGAAIAVALAGAGAAVVAAGRREAALAETAARGEGVEPLVADVTDEDSVAAMFAAAGDIDILIVNAGIAETRPFHKTDLAFWRRSMAVNLDGAFLTMRGALPGMVARGWGRIVAIASVAGQRGVAYGAAYSASKHGVIGLTRSVAEETLTKGVTANAICPGFVATAIVERSVANIVEKTGRGEAEARRTLAEMNPNGRLVAPEEVAAAALWLCGPGSDSVTGQTVQIAGGHV